jgi:glycerol-3-phosphate cytidylyltransferase
MESGNHEQDRYNKMTIGFTCGAFDLLHAGHVVMLKQAKENCDHLIVGLQTDPSIDRQEKNQPVQSVYERFVQLNAVKYVDEVIPYDTEQSLLDLLESTPIDVRFVGEDYKDKHFTGEELPIKVFYTNRKHSFSTSSLRDRIKL